MKMLNVCLLFVMGRSRSARISKVHKKTKLGVMLNNNNH